MKPTSSPSIYSATNSLAAPKTPNGPHRWASRWTMEITATDSKAIAAA
jgi:hypothetical protein